MKPSDRGDDYPYERFSSRRLYYAFDFLPGTNDILYSSNTSGQFNLWRQSPPDRSGNVAARQQSGFDEWTIRYIDPEPVMGRFTVVFADKDGNENYQIFLVDNKNGWQRPLVSKDGVRNTFGLGCLSPDGRLAAYSSNERSPMYLDIVLTKISDGETKRILSSDASYSFGEWSPDSRYCTIIESKNLIDDTDVCLLDTKTGKNKRLTPHEDRALYMPCSWNKKGNGFYLIANEGREFFGLAFVDVTKDGSKLKWVETPSYDIEDAVLSPNGKILAWVSNQDGYSFIHLKDVTSGRMLGPQQIETGGWIFGGWFENQKLLKFSEDSKKILFELTTPVHPEELYVLNIPASRNIVQYTNGFVGNIPRKMMFEPKIVHYDSFDRKIPAYLYKPRLRKGELAPVVVHIHGGPMMQERPSWFYGFFQYLLSKGIGVLALNIRGSSGYGKSYMHLIARDWGATNSKISSMRQSIFID
jgi:dipeptidyl aminopeptidase/acylaminoacyl peptidase